MAELRRLELEWRARRLSFRGLRTTDAALVAAGLAAAVGVGLAAVMNVLRIVPPGGIIRDSTDPTLPSISRFGVAVALLAIAVGMALLGRATSTPGWRFPRLTMILIGAFGFAIVPVAGHVVNAPITSQVFSGLGWLAAILVIAIAIRTSWLRSPMISVLAAAPAVLALGAIMAASGTPDAESFLVIQVVKDIPVAKGALAVLAIWGVVQYTRGVAAGAQVSLPVHGALGWLAVLLLLKAAVLAGDLLNLPFPLVPATSPVRELASTGPLLLVATFAMTAAGGWLLLRQARLGHVRAPSVGVAVVAVLPILAAFIWPAPFQVAQKALVLVPTDQSVAAYSAIGEFGYREVQPRVLAIGVPASCLGAAIAALAIVFLSSRHRWSGTALFLAAFAVWAAIPATQWFAARMWGAPTSATPAPFLVVDLCLSVIAAPLALMWTRGRRLVPPGVLLGLILTSTILAYSPLWTGGELRVIAFWIAVAFPVVAKLGFDAADLNRDEPRRRGLVLGTMGVVAITAGALLPGIALGQVRPDLISEGDIARDYLFVPLAAVIMAARLGKPNRASASQDAHDTTAPG